MSYTGGHCKEKQKPGGCKLHNLQCGYPHPDEDDAVTLWAEIHRLRAAVQGPDGYATWQEAATAERVRRVAAEKALAAAPSPAPAPELADEQIDAIGFQWWEWSESRAIGNGDTLVFCEFSLRRLRHFVRACLAAAAQAPSVGYEPVAEVTRWLATDHHSEGENELYWLKPERLPVGTKLYTDPPIGAQQARADEVLVGELVAATLAEEREHEADAGDADKDAAMAASKPPVQHKEAQR